jgi:hypothetical protein
MISELYLLAYLVFGFPVQLVVFYLLGRRYPVNGRTYRYFGLLFAGLYVGSIIGAVLSVALFGQSSWVFPAGQSSSAFRDGILYQNVAPSLLVLLESLNPISSLPFLPFFAMSVSRKSPASLSLEGQS